MPLIERCSAVVHLQVHLENFQSANFNKSTVHQVANVEPPANTLALFFNLFANDDFPRKKKLCTPTFQSATGGMYQLRLGKEDNMGKKQKQGWIRTIKRICSVSPKQVIVFTFVYFWCQSRNLRPWKC